jgi:hypothetical protein
LLARLARARHTFASKYVVASALAVVALVAALGVLWYARSKRATGVTGPLAAVPHDAWLVVVVDVAALRQSPLAKAALGAGPATVLPGLGSPVDVCGFDPVSKLREVVVASPEGEERGDFGVAFSGDFEKGELAGCAEKIIRARGGEPSTSAQGSFTVIEGTAGAKATPNARVAYREGGPFLVGRGGWLDAMVDAAEGKAARARPEHEALREALRARQPHSSGNGSQRSGSAPAISITAVLPKSLRERLKGEIPPGGEERTYASVLAVEEAALSLYTGGPGSSTEIAAELRCESQADCESLRAFAERKRFALSRELAIRVIGLGPLIDSLAVEVNGASLFAAAHGSTDDLGRAVERAVSFLSGRRAPP